MSDMKKLTIGSTEYNVVDETARNSISNLATVATTGSYTDLSNTPPSANTNISDEYDSSKTYNTGDVVIHDSVLYICDGTSITGDWDSTKWIQTTVKQLLSLKANISSLANVATSGSYSDLSKKPTIPSKVSQLTNDTGFITESTAPVRRQYAGWGTSVTSEFARNQYLVLVSNVTLYVVWFASTNDINIVNLYTDKRFYSSSYSVTDTDTSIKFTRNNNGTLTVDNVSTLQTWTIIG